MLLNCDLGEFKNNNDADIMPYIDMANIACGFHGSDPSTIRKTVALAAQHKVTIGAHPSYPDKENFGRTSMAMPAQELTDCIVYQVGVLQTLAAIENTHVSYVKPHGALYNDMMQDTEIFTIVCKAITQLNKQNLAPLSLLMQGLIEEYVCKFNDIAKQYDIKLHYEAFADRAYQDNGLLVPRSKQNAVLTNKTDVIKRCQTLLRDKHILSVNQQQLSFAIDTLCVHGDTPNALEMIKTLRQTINNHHA